jgi:RND family efflux transporter MFP subunit
MGFGRGMIRAIYLLESLTLRRLPFSTAIVIAAALLTSCSSQTVAPPPTPVVGVIVAKAGAVPLMTELTGRTMPSETADVRPQVSGLITARLFTEGSEVRKGQPLYQIDARPYAATEAQARAALANAQAVVESSRLKAERYRTLAATGGISKQDAADADAVWQQSRAQVAAARASLDAARVNLSFTRIVAPISGRIGQSSVTRGALVTSDQALALSKIQRLDPIWVDIQQSSADFIALRHALETGQLTSAGSAPVTIVLADGTQWPSPGRLDFADIDVNEMTGTVTLRVTVPNPRGDLLPGLFVKARLTQGMIANGILLPQAAVSRDPRGNPVVLVVGHGDVVESRTVATATTFGANWLITGGLRPGERVVVEGQLTARPGTHVKVAPALIAKGG